MSKIKRFHKNIYFPDNIEKYINDFVSTVNKNGPLTLSVHATEKLIDLTLDFGKSLFKDYVSIIRSNILVPNNIFEFYWYKSGEIVKACFRNSFRDFPVDIITVISNTGNIITVYSTRKNDQHSTMDVALYEKRSRKND
jgi:hypothetical protein